jgi:broad specificity phosphatase PhoE
LVVRHADREPGRDPDLNAAGRARAQALVEPARRAGVVAVYHTQYKRTKQTAEPAAVALGIPLIQIDVVAGHESEHADALVRHIESHYAGKPVLIVGHSNTIPMVLRKLGVPAPREIPDAEYGTIFIVTNGKVTEERFGS